MNQQPKLLINLENDLKQILIGQFRNGGYNFDTKAPTKDVVRHYYNIRFREISIKPRVIHISKELNEKIPTSNLQSSLNILLEKMKNGERLTSYLSSEIVNPTYNDLLLNDWKIHHLHLGDGLQENDKRFVKRTNELLFTRVEEDAIYLLDILDHDLIESFANQNLVQIIHNNWPELIASYKVRGLSPNKISNEEMHKVRKAHVTTAVSVADGTTYFPTGGGYASDGSNLQITRMSDMLMARIIGMEKAIRANEAELRKQLQEKIGRCPSTLKLTLKGWDEAGIQLVEKRTKRELFLPWA